MSYCEIPQATAAQERKGSMGNLLTTLWTHWKSVFQQELGLTMNKTTSSQKILNLGMGEISFLCPGIGILELATRMIAVKCFVLEDVLLLF